MVYTPVGNHYKYSTACNPVALTIVLVLFLPMPLTSAAVELRLYAGAGLRQPVDRLVDAFQRTTGNRVVVDYDGSGRLLARIIASGQGDLFMPGSLFYIEKLEKEGLIHSRRPIVAHTPVIAVNKARASDIGSLADMTRPGIRVALGDPKAMALGKTALTILERSGLKDKILANVLVYGATVKQLVLYAAEGTVDAAIVSRNDAFQFKDRVTMVPIPETLYDPETVAVAVLNSTSDVKTACALRDFLAALSNREVFTQFGFLPLKQKD